MKSTPTSATPGVRKTNRNQGKSDGAGATNALDLGTSPTRDVRRMSISSPAPAAVNAFGSSGGGGGGVAAVAATRVMVLTTPTSSLDRSNIMRSPTRTAVGTTTRSPRSGVGVRQIDDAGPASGTEGGHSTGATM